jgi:hypothetical protein
MSARPSAIGASTEANSLFDGVCLRRDHCAKRSLRIGIAHDCRRGCVHDLITGAYAKKLSSFTGSTLQANAAPAQSKTTTRDAFNEADIAPMPTYV